MWGDQLGLMWRGQLVLMWELRVSGTDVGRVSVRLIWDSGKASGIDVGKASGEDVGKKFIEV